MRGTAHDTQTDYVEFVHENKNYRFNLSFLTSNWKCIYGDGCAGHFGKADAHFQPDVGCCSMGAFIEDEEFEAVSNRVSQLTDDEWSPELREAADKDGWFVNKNDKKTRKYKGSCIFNNRVGGKNGKVGCSFHILAERLGEHFVETKPRVCWEVPLRHYEDQDGVEIIDAWDADDWGGVEEDGTHDSWMCWACVDTPDAYVGKKMVYQEMSAELTKMLGAGAYAEMVNQIVLRMNNYITPMKGSQVNNGKPMLPLIIINKKPARTFGGYSS
jgi:hypothetical protein